MSAPRDFSKAHSVDQTMALSKGVAVKFRQKYGQVDALRAQNKRVGQVAVLDDGPDSKVLYMVAKGKPFHKWSPRYNVSFKANYVKGFRGLKDECVRSKVRKLAIPAMGTGLDRLQWPWVREKIERIFHDVDIHIRVYHRPPRERRARSQQPDGSTAVNNGVPEQPVSDPGSSQASSVADKGPVVLPLPTIPVLPRATVLIPQQGPVVSPLPTTPVLHRAPVVIPQQAPVLPPSTQSSLPPSQQLLQTYHGLFDAASVLVDMSLGDNKRVSSTTELPTALNPGATSFSSYAPTVPVAPGGILATQEGVPSISALLSEMDSSVALSLRSLSDPCLSYGHQDNVPTVCINESSEEGSYSDSERGFGLFD
jgi:hypothetical protein